MPANNVHGYIKTGLRSRGFTMIEILTTIVIIGVLATAAVPIGQLMIIRQQEKLLKEALAESRQALDKFYEHYKTYPASFMELRGLDPPGFTITYLRDAPPINPFTGDQYDWEIITAGATEHNPNSGCHAVACKDFMAHNVEVHQFYKRVADILAVKLAAEINEAKNLLLADYSEEDAEKLAAADVINKAMQWDAEGKRRSETNEAIQQAAGELKPTLKYFIPDVKKTDSKRENDYYTYWCMWDIRYPRDDRLAINETLYKDW